VFAGDEWRHSSLTARAGVRWDRQFVRTEDGAEIVRAAGWSPRLSVSWMPEALHGWQLAGGYARYQTSVLETTDPLWLASPPVQVLAYEGPAIGAASRALAIAPGLTIGHAVGSAAPHTSEWVAGAHGPVVAGAEVRADVFWRRSGGASAWTALSGADLRQHAGLVLQTRYRVGVLARVGASYTLSRLWGPADAGWLTDPLALVPLAHPGVDAGWAAPDGDLSGDRRHHVRAWAHVDLIVSESLGIVGLDVLQTSASGRPYGLVGWIDAAPFSTGGGDGRAPLAAPYWFTARDEFRTEGVNRTDLALRYSRPLPGTVHGTVFVRLDVLDLFDGDRAPDPLAGAATAFTDPGGLQRFDPFRERPIEGVHWRRPDDPTGSELVSTRAVRLVGGVRF
jgi:hypothetical protein